MNSLDASNIPSSLILPPHPPPQQLFSWPRYYRRNMDVCICVWCINPTQRFLLFHLLWNWELQKCGAFIIICAKVEIQSLFIRVAFLMKLRCHVLEFLANLFLLWHEILNTSKPSEKKKKKRKIKRDFLFLISLPRNFRNAFPLPSIFLKLEPFLQVSVCVVAKIPTKWSIMNYLLSTSIHSVL